MTVRSTLELREYQTRRSPAPPPTPDDLRFTDALSAGSGGPQLDIRWLVGNEVEVTSSTWVGVVRLSGFDIHVTPKYVGGGLRLLKMLEYARRTQFTRQLNNTRTLEAHGEHLPELLCKLLTDEAAALLRQGLLHSYRSQSDDLPVLRGRLDYRAQYLRRFGQLDRLHCTFDEFDADNADNQLLSAALNVAQGIVEEPQLRHALTQLRVVYDGVCTPPTLNPTWYRQRITYGRLNERYRPAHALCYLILDHVAFDDLYDTRGHLSLRSFLLNMNMLFEEFVTTLFTDALRGTDFRVEPKERLRATILNAETSRTYATLVPDLVLAHDATRGGPARRTPVDVKYKLYDDRKLGSADIYQSFTYALALSTGDLDARGGIIYPGDQTGIAARLDITPSAAPTRARITAASLAVDHILDQIQSDGTLSDGLQRDVQRIAETLTLGRPSGSLTHLPVN